MLTFSHPNIIFVFFEPSPIKVFFDVCKVAVALFKPKPEPNPKAEPKLTKQLQQQLHNNQKHILFYRGNEEPYRHWKKSGSGWAV